MTAQASRFVPDQPPKISCGYLTERVRAAFGPHPFTAQMSEDQVAGLLPEYLAMSQAFPYLLAGAQRELVFHAMERNQDIARDIELTSVVANFICWNATGCHGGILRGGKAALPDILLIENIYSNLLRKDAFQLLRKEIRPNYTARTKQYLHSLYAGLSSDNSLVRCAYMIAFELHAADMTKSLCASLVNTFKARPDDHEYFNGHDGGRDPAEKYHGEMTGRLIGELVQLNRGDRFLDGFDRAYRLSFQWCSGLIGTFLAHES
ncbi:hypothetical protein [Bradyrhizobium centrosematis]|uniref:hypothetical protein n=1 Tax=Bradyrhizobium centrosematis TaxID=1300039 RepID=UPI00388D1718